MPWPNHQWRELLISLDLLLICLGWSSSLHFLLETKWTSCELHYKNFPPSAKQIAQNGRNTCINMLAATKNPTLSYINIMEPRVLKLLLHTEILAPATEVILVLTLHVTLSSPVPVTPSLLPCNHLLSHLLWRLPLPGTVRKPKFHLPQTVWRASWLFRL